MSAIIISRDKNSITIQTTLEFSNNSMLESEEAILNALNETGTLATSEALKQFDTDGSPIQIQGKKWTSKGKDPKTYQTPSGEVEVARHWYQNSEGGETYCPLEHDARIIVTSTPRFAKMVSSKYAKMSSPQAQTDLEENHGRVTARSGLQNLSDAVGQIAHAKEDVWHYATPKLDEPVKAVSIGVDGTGLLYCQEGYRQAMVGTIAFYDKEGERLLTHYQGTTPSSRKATFWQRMTQEIAHVKSVYPHADYVGVADGAKDNWSFLEQHTKRQILDFYHATGYLEAVAPAAYPHNKAKRQKWVDERCHQLKHEEGKASQILEEIKTFRQNKLGKSASDTLESAITFFENHWHQMDYASAIEAHLPIGSGVTEAACKTVVKQRLCQSGMKWKEKGASIVLGLRTLVLTKGRWKQFWDKITRYGLPSET